VRYELNFYIVFRRNSVFKGLTASDETEGSKEERNIKTKNEVKIENRK
jgi:hypothetical protein